MDYGHDLIFGAFVVPTNAEPHRPVEIARHADAVGLDLVAIQDHPYQPAFHDTWTLLSYLAGVTERVRLVGDVLNLPLRPPAILARSVATLDRLSGGRAELGLGAGAFWDAIAAMGGPRRTAAESVQALGEAIDVIRALWTTQGPRLDLPGRFYSLDGAKRGPAPAHDVGIWVGAYKPRMLRLVGEKADGWLPSLSYLDGPSALAEGNARIDDAAHAAGRDPRSVRRLLNVDGALLAQRRGFLQGPVDAWVDDLASLALEHGVSAFIGPGSDERLLDVLAHEVAPAVRELVAQERAA